MSLEDVLSEVEIKKQLNRLMLFKRQLEQCGSLSESIPNHSYRHIYEYERIVIINKMPSPEDKESQLRPVEEERSSRGNAEESSMDSWLAFPPPVERREEFRDEHYHQEIHHSYRKVERWLNNAGNTPWFEAPYFDEEDRLRVTARVEQMYDSKGCTYISLNRPSYRSVVDFTRRLEQFLHVRSDRFTRWRTQRIQTSYITNWDFIERTKRAVYAPTIALSSMAESLGQQKQDHEVPDFNKQPLFEISRVGIRNRFRRHQYVRGTLSTSSNLIQLVPRLTQDEVSGQPRNLNSNGLPTLELFRNINQIPSTQWTSNLADQDQFRQYQFNNPSNINLNPMPIYDWQQSTAEQNHYSQYQNEYLSNTTHLSPFTANAEQWYQNRYYAQQENDGNANAMPSYKVLPNQTEQTQFGQFQYAEYPYNTSHEMTSINLPSNGVAPDRLGSYQNIPQTSNINSQDTNYPSNNTGYDQLRQYEDIWNPYYTSTNYIASNGTGQSGRLDSSELRQYQDFQQPRNNILHDATSADFQNNGAEVDELRQHQDGAYPYYINSTDFLNNSTGQDELRQHQDVAYPYNTTSTDFLNNGTELRQHQDTDYPYNTTSTDFLNNGTELRQHQDVEYPYHITSTDFPNNGVGQDELRQHQDVVYPYNITSTDFPNNGVGQDELRQHQNVGYPYNTTSTDFLNNGTELREHQDVDYPYNITSTDFPNNGVGQDELRQHQNVGYPYNITSTNFLNNGTELRQHQDVGYPYNITSTDFLNNGTELREHQDVDYSYNITSTDFPNNGAGQDELRQYTDIEHPYNITSTDFASNGAVKEEYRQYQYINQPSITTSQDITSTDFPFIGTGPDQFQQRQTAQQSLDNTSQEVTNAGQNQFWQYENFQQQHNFNSQEIASTDFPPNNSGQDQFRQYEAVEQPYDVIEQEVSSTNFPTNSAEQDELRQQYENVLQMYNIDF